MAPMSAAHLTAAQRLRAYEALAPADCAIVQVLAVAFDAMTRTNLLASLKHLGVRQSPDGKSLNNDRLLARLDLLVAAGVIEPRGYLYGCHPKIDHAVMQRCVRLGQLAATMEAIRAATAKANFEIPTLRVALYEKNFVRVAAMLQHADRNATGHPLRLLLESRLDGSWLRSWPEPIVTEALASILEYSFLHLLPAKDAFGFLVSYCSEATRSPQLRALLAIERSLRGQLENAMDSIEAFRAPDELAAGAWVAFLCRDAKVHSDCFSGWQKSTDVPNTLPFIASLCLLARTLACLEQRSDREVLTVVQDARRRHASPWLPALLEFVKLPVTATQSQLGPHGPIDSMLGHWMLREKAGIFRLVAQVVRGWVGLDFDEQEMRHLRDEAARSGYAWMVAEVDDLGTAIEGPAPSRRGRLREVVSKSEAWMRTLDALEQLAAHAVELPKTPERAPVASNIRLAWALELGAVWCTIRPIEQKLDARGKWTQGRRVALERLYTSGATMTHLDPQDRAILATLKSTTYRSHGYPETTYDFDTRRALFAMLGHPRVYLDGATLTPVDLVEGPPVVTVTTEGEDVVLRFVPRLHKDQSVTVGQVSATLVRVVFPSSAVLAYAEIIGDGLRVPLRAQDRIAKLLGPLASVATIQSAIGGASETLAKVKTHSGVTALLRSHGAGVAVRLVVRPFGTAEPMFAPGVGEETVIAEVAAKRVQTRRSLDAEKQEEAALLAACPTLGRWTGVAHEWLIASADESLELILELGAQKRANVEWTTIETFKVRDVVSPSQLSLRIGRERDGFAATGEVRLSGKATLDLGRLLDLLEASPGRFLRMDDGEFLALQGTLRERLDELRALSERNGQSIRFHPLAAVALDGWMDACATVTGDAAWKLHVAKFRAAQHLDPTLPPTLDAELRSYQLEGYRWLARLAHWGAGACLADDMGVGKTVQALTLLISRAPEGPALVVAPTSVCLNWVDEARRFAPTLRFHLLAGADRLELLKQAGPFDVVVASYGLLLQEREALAGVKWHTVVLDEAQAIKNAAARRSVAAMDLKAGFKMVTTGTPIENNLGELWNLFQFINPGLLGSLKTFNERFGVPIERNKDRVVRARLKRLLQPFILRRTKSQVLPELPARTDVVLRVDLGAEEAAVYEALRASAIEKLSGGRPGQIQVLAEIMRLRRACCHPRLVLPDAPLATARLSVFGEIVSELVANHHRALVFSQFVDHLSIVREYLDAQGIRYQYLDGSTQVEARKRGVDAFQSGEGDLFLISLKAGGLGLNLTAADYVVHLDPWWNPAVEDQATDRAYRLGQIRPVTVYRIVARHTIEEKILALHDRKRDLASRLLEGSDLSGAMSAEELLVLIRDEA